MAYGVLISLAVTGIGASVAFAKGALAQVAFEWTDAARFRAWETRPLLDSGLVAVAGVVAGLGLWLIGRQRLQLLSAAAAACVVAMGALAWGVVVESARSHPEVDRARALATLLLPGGYAGGAVRVLHAGRADAPSATRLWTTSIPPLEACEDVKRSLEAWADVGTVHGSPGTDGCDWGATWHHHFVNASVDATATTTSVAIGLSW